MNHFNPFSLFSLKSFCSKIRFSTIRSLSILTLLTLFWVFPTNHVLAADPTHPFYPGEKLDYVLKWTVVHAGEASLEVLPIKTINGKKAYHFVLTAKSNSFIDMIYKVRDRIESFTDIDMQHSILYKKKQNEGPTQRDITVTFDWDKHQAQYSNYNEQHSPITLIPGAFDPLSAFFYSRFLDLDIDSQFSRPVTDGKKCVMGKANVLKKETITIESGTYDTILVEPDIEHVGGVFEKSKDAKIRIWLTADERKIPVKLESKVIVGHFTGELVTKINQKPLPEISTGASADVSNLLIPINSYE